MVIFFLKVLLFLEKDRFHVVQMKYQNFGQETLRIQEQYSIHNFT